MAVDPRTPVIVGVAQLAPEEPAPEPIELMSQALRQAADDATGPELLSRADTVAIPKGVWPYNDPGRLVARHLGCPDATTVRTAMGGNFCQTLLNRMADDIQKGERDVVLLASAETMRTRRRDRTKGTRTTYTLQEGAPDVVLGDDETPMFHPAEAAVGMVPPTTAYAMFESAIRHSRGESVEAHRTRIASLWEGFAAVAADNPLAVVRSAPDAGTIATPSASNRMIAAPYPKLMTSNINVDMGAGLVLCSAGTASALGIAADRWVFPQVGTDATDHWFMSHRHRLDRSPALHHAGMAALALAGVGIDDVAHIDVYSCFPSAVEVACTELGIDETRQLTVTGGLTFFGGPLNSYVLHSITTMTDVLRNAPGEVGFVTANGGYLTKHAFGVYGTEPPSRGFVRADLQAEAATTPRRELAADHAGPVTIEAYTVVFDREGASQGIAASLTPEGHRTWATTRDPGAMAKLQEDDACGHAATRTSEGEIEL